MSPDVEQPKPALYAREQYSLLLEASPDAIVMVDREGRIFAANQLAGELFGYTGGELAGQPIETLIPERFRPGHRGHREGYQRDPSMRPMGAGLQLFGRRKDGQEFPVDIALSPLQTAEGPMVFAAVRDVSRHKVLEAELRQALEAAETANRLKSEFLANMSHELRTPLNSIIGFSEILADGKAGTVTDQQKEFLGDVLYSSRHLLQMINDLLDLSKIEAGKMDFRFEPVDLKSLCHEAMAMLRTQAEKRGIRISVKVEPGVERVEGDPARLRQVLFNYLSNAVKFSHDQGQVELWAAPAGSSGYRLEVRDQGIGIKPEDQARLFTPFHQADSGKGKKYQGTGLGLSLSKRIVEAHGGTVGLQSELGKGSLFYAQMPVKPTGPF
jgi:protein-histidine pros-kinase